MNYEMYSILKIIVAGVFILAGTFKVIDTKIESNLVKANAIVEMVNAGANPIDAACSVNGQLYECLAQTKFINDMQVSDAICTFNKKSRSAREDCLIRDLILNGIDPLGARCAIQGTQCSKYAELIENK